MRVFGEIGITVAVRIGIRGALHQVAKRGREVPEPPKREVVGFRLCHGGEKAGSCYGGER